ncbi:MAG: pyridoxal-phosphate dependent enzyme [Rhodocyclaceae bacterium]|jgi:threonine synthase|nr:pyridoxal-phosphate dependent enzyme [Rhodocyclaceae bacterium]
MKWFYRCPSCDACYDIVPGRYLCDACATRQQADRPLEGVLEVEWEGDPAPATLPLPVEPEWFPPIPVGNTPLWAPVRVRAEFNAPNLWLKDDTCNPSGSLKDRASFLVAAFARKHGLKEIVLASTGNAASSMAAVGAAAGLHIKVFLPASAPVAKRIQVLQYGAELVSVDGNYDKAFDLSLEYSSRTGALSRNTAYNPLTIEGKKTVAYEIVDDLLKAGAGAPAHIFVPVGDGVIIAGVYRGFENLLRLGRIASMPTVWACQAEGSSGIARALASCHAGHAGSDDFGDPVSSSTIADSIAVDVPRNGLHALSKLKKYGGRSVVVSDAEILAAQKTLSSGSGLFAEPSSSAAFAGWLKVRETIPTADTCVLLITGSGLKDIKAAALGLDLGPEQ